MIIPTARGNHLVASLNDDELLFQWTDGKGRVILPVDVEFISVSKDEMLLVYNLLAEIKRKGLSIGDTMVNAGFYDCIENLAQQRNGGENY